MSDQTDNSGRKNDIAKALALSKDLSKKTKRSSKKTKKLSKGKGLPKEIGELFLEGNPLHFLARLGVDIATAKRTIQNHDQVGKQINTLELSTKTSPKESKEVIAFIETLEELHLLNIAYEKNDDPERDKQIATPMDYNFLLLLDKDEIIRNAGKMMEIFHQKMQKGDPHLAAIRQGVTLRKTSPDDRNQKAPSEQQNLISSLSSVMDKMQRVSREEANDDENQFEELTSTNKPQKQQAEPHRAEPRRAEPHRAEPRRAEPHRAEPRRAEPHRAEPHRAEPRRAEPQRAEPWRAEPQRAEPRRAEPHRAEPQRAEPRRAEPQRAESQQRTVPQQRAEPRRAAPQRAEQPRRANPQRVEPPVVAPAHPSHARAPDIDNRNDIWENIKASISQLDANKVTGVANKYAIRQLKNFVDEKDKMNPQDSRAIALRSRAFDEIAQRILNDLKAMKDPSVRDVVQALQIQNTPEKPGARPRR